MKAIVKIALIATTLLASCIKNDIPMPIVELQIASVEGEGLRVKNIDLTARKVFLEVEEKTDIQQAQITKVGYDAVIHSIHADKEALLQEMTVSKELVGTFDLRTPIYVTLSLYQDYEWSIVGEQTIERIVNFVGQIGEAEYDLKNRIVRVKINHTVDLSHLIIKDFQLEPEGITTYSPTVEELSGSDFSTIRFVDVTCHGRTERWTIEATHTEKSVTLTAANAWTRVLWLEGDGISGEVMGFRYRKQGEEGWKSLSTADADSPITATGGRFKARVVVEPLTTYEVKAFCGDKESESVVVTTEEERQLPNGNMEHWGKIGKAWYPFAVTADESPIDPFWGSGNKASTTMGENYNLTTAVTDTPAGVTGQYAAQLESRYVVLKLAAGNLFTGEFAAIRNTTHGIVNFGRPFTLRPTALRLWVRYTCGQITNAKDIGSMPIGESIQIGDYDQGSVYIALGTWTKEKYGYGKGKEELFGTDECPISIDTRDVSTFFNPNGEDVIGYGGRIFTESVEEWTQLTIPIEYRDYATPPTHIVVVCSASRFGDYFTGSRNSRMWVDEIELLYD